ncbi:MAG: DUF2934 domain-containing protein [Candidatus Acidiferrales bacterium]
MRRQADPRTPVTQSAGRASKPADRRERAAEPDKVRLAQESETTLGPSPTVPAEDQIRKRAFEIYASGQHPSNDAVEIWLQAERELRRA